MSSWCVENGIHMNVDKTCTMVFGSTRSLKNLSQFDIKVGGDAVKNVNSYKYLGITLDSQLN